MFLQGVVWAKGIASANVLSGEVGGRSSGRVGGGLGPTLSSEVRNWDFFLSASAIGGVRAGVDFIFKRSLCCCVDWGRRDSRQTREKALR